MANSTRMGRINDDIQNALSTLLRQVKDPRVQQGMISVTRVETTGDLRYAKVWLSVLGELDKREFKRGLKSCGPWLRRELGAALSLALYAGAGVRTRPLHRVRRTHQQAHRGAGHWQGGHGCT